MLDKTNILFRQSIVVRFSGDSGDGMQLAGNIFSNISAERGDQISTFPDYPAEVRAPQGSLNGVSGFQVHVGLGVHTPGDECDVLISMNPAALKQNAKFLKTNGVAIVDIDSFKKIDLEKALFKIDVLTCANRNCSAVFKPYILVGIHPRHHILNPSKIIRLHSF